MKLRLAALALLALSLAPATTADLALTVPELVRSQVGGAATVAYNRIRTIAITVAPQAGTIRVDFEIFVSSDAAVPPKSGTYTVRNSTATMRIPDLGIETGITLTAGQQAAVAAYIDNHRDTTESSLVTFGLVSGTQI